MDADGNTGRISRHMCIDSGRSTLLLMVAIGAGCSASPSATRLKPDAGEVADLPIERRSDEPLMIILPQQDASSPKDAAGTDLTLSCQTTVSGSDDAGTLMFPLDWQSAQSLSAWCGMYQSWPPTSLCFSQTIDGYKEVQILYDVGGEMLIVNRVFFLYEQGSGRFVEELSAGLGSPLECWIGTPNGPSNPAVDPHGCSLLGATPLQPVCAPTALDGGIWNQRKTSE
jgi:hypothetical protein